MWIALTGRIIFAAGIMGLGAVCVVFGDFVNSLQPVPQWMPGYAPLALATGFFLVVAGALVMANVKTILAAAGLAVLLASWIVLLHVPSAFTDPILLRSPWWIRTFETLALAGACLVVAGRASAPVRERRVRAGRIMFGISLPVFGILHFVYADNVASLVPDFYPWPLFLAYLTGAGHFAAGVAIASGTWVRLAATLAGCMYAVWALTLHLPRVLDHPPAYQGDRPELTSLFVCVAFWGAAWIVAGSSRRRTGW